MMHKCRSRERFDEIVNHYLGKWLSRDNMKEFAQYFAKQWLNSHLNKWQLFERKSGLSITNKELALNAKM